jgi:hypothetical protein
MKLRLVWLGLAAFLLAMITVLPVRWIAWLAPAQVKCTTWAGSVWRGECRGLVVRQEGQSLDADLLSWKLHPASLLRLSIKSDFSVRNAQGTGSGVAEIGRNGLMVVEELDVSTLFDRRLATMLPVGWKGQLETRNLTVRMKGNKLQTLSGEINLRDFSDARGTSFGSYRLVFPPAAAPPFAGRITDTNGPLEIAASLTISADRRWQLDGLITPRRDAPAELRSNLELLSAPDASGRYRLLSEGTFR